VDSYEVNNQKYNIWKSSFRIEGFEEYVMRIEPLLLMYIETACNVEYDDMNWEYYLVHNQVNKV